MAEATTSAPHVASELSAVGADNACSSDLLIQHIPNSFNIAIDVKAIALFSHSKPIAQFANLSAVVCVFLLCPTVDPCCDHLKRRLALAVTA